MVRLFSSDDPEQLIERARHRFELSMGSPQAMAMLTGPFYIFSCVNPAFCSLLNRSAKDFVGKPFAEVMPGVAECLEHLESVCRTGRSTVYTPRNDSLSLPGGWSVSMWPVYEGGKKVGAMIQLTETNRYQRQSQELNGALIVSSVRQHELTEAAEKLAKRLHEEVAERTRLLEALRVSEEGFRLIVASIKDYTILLLDVEGNIANWNAGAERFQGYKADEILGKHFSIFYPKVDQDSRKPEAELKIAVAEGRFEEEGWRVRSDGSRYWASVIISALHNEAGVLRGFSKVTRDITARKNMEDALNDAHVLLASRARQLEHEVFLRTTELIATNEQLEAFVYSIAHDLRAPLRSMQSFASLLVDEAGPLLDETCQDYANRINKSAQFMDALLIGLLAFSQISQAEVILAPVDLGKSVEILLSRLEGDIKDRHASIQAPGPWPEVFAHEATLAQILFNLTSNALKFVELGVPPKIRLTTEDRLDFTRVWVEDNGVGIASANQEQVFRLFNRLNGEKYPGTGVGLAIVQKGIERMGGRVGVEEATGGGSRFWFELKKVKAVTRPI